MLKMYQTLRETLTTKKLFPTFKATLQLQGVDFSKAKFYVYKAFDGKDILSDLTIENMEELLPFFNKLKAKDIGKISIILDEERNLHYIGIYVW